MIVELEIYEAIIERKMDLPEAITVASPANTPNPRLVTVPFSSMHATLPITIIIMPQTICENTKISCKYLVAERVYVEGWAATKMLKWFKVNEKKKVWLEVRNLVNRT